MKFDWIDDIGSMLIAITATGKIAAANSQVCRVLQYGCAEILGMNLKQLLEDPESNVDNFIKGLPQIQPITLTSKVQLICKNGEKKSVQGTVIRLDDVDAAVFLFFCHMRNIENLTPDRQFDQGMRDFQIKTLGRMTEAFIGEFRNIFGIVTGYTEMVREGLPENDEIKNDLGEVLSACSRGKNLLNKISSFCNNAQGGGVTLDAERSVGVMFENIKAAFPPQIVLEYSSTVKRSSIAVDPVKLEQVLIGICLALCDRGKFPRSPNSITIRLGNIEPGFASQWNTLSEKMYVQIVIQSEALQLDGDFIDRFNCSDEQFICNCEELESVLCSGRSILRELNGQIFLSSSEKNRTAISILFPVVDKSAVGKPEYAGPPHGKGQNVLIVDDEIQVADLTARRLEKLGYRVVKKTNSIEALEYFSSNFEMFSLLIVDQAMPDLPGLEFAQEVKKIKPDIPIVMMTGYSSGITEKKCKAYGIKNLAMKPIDEKELAAIVASALR
jgi:PAS domain S-box-containing protein